MNTSSITPNRDDQQAIATPSTKSIAPKLDIHASVIDVALQADVPGGAKVFHWLPQDDANKPHKTARAVMRAAIEAVLADLGDRVPVAPAAKRFPFPSFHGHQADEVNLENAWQVLLPLLGAQSWTPQERRDFRAFFAWGWEASRQWHTTAVPVASIGVGKRDDITGQRMTFTRSLPALKDLPAGVYQLFPILADMAPAEPTGEVKDGDQ